MRMVFNKSTGRYFELDEKMSRYTRMCRRVFAWAEQLSAFDVDVYMHTLTYKVTETWDKNDIRSFVRSLRKFHLLAYAWVAEMQERHEVHYHLLAVVPKGYRYFSAYIDRGKPTQKIRWGIGWVSEFGYWSKGREGTDVSDTPFYIVSYTSKMAQKFSAFPKGIRTYGLYLDKKRFDELSLQRFHVSVCPAWLTDIIKASPDLHGFKVHRTAGGYYVGDIFIPSPFQVGYAKDNTIQGFHNERWGLTGEVGEVSLDVYNDYLSTLDRLDG